MVVAKLKQKWFNRTWLIQQLKLNIVALISLVTAIVGISYNTWRDHQNEINDNMRKAAFEVLTDLGELQTIVNYAHYEADKTRGHPIEGWKHVVMVRDLSHLLTADAAKAGDALYTHWQKHWENLGVDNETELLISHQITKTRQAVLTTIDSLK
ncbi:MAG: hypothetical protein V4605_00080 [Pseudomonadota bacterium]